MRPRWQTFLRLGRVSNLPTVWSNVVAGIVLGGSALDAGSVLGLGLAASLFYVGGMFLNDAFDRRSDARERPERPIPSGAIGAAPVFGIGFGLLGGGLAVLALHAALSRRDALAPLGSGLALAAAVVAYDAWHKGNPLSPLLMGLCRALVYVTAAFGTSGVAGAPLLAGAIALLSYVAGLTYVAKHETLSRVQRLWPVVFLIAPLAWAPVAAGRRFFEGAPAFFWLLLAGWSLRCVGLLRRDARGDTLRAVVGMVAGISLCDALLIAANGSPAAAAVSALAFPATLLLQRWVSGT